MTDVRQLKERIERNGLAGRESLTDALKLIMECVDDLKKEHKTYDNWMYTLKGALIIIPVVMGMLSWWVLDLHERLGAKVNESTRLEMLARINERLDQLNDHVEATDNRLDTLRDRFFFRKDPPG